MADKKTTTTTEDDIVARLSPYPYPPAWFEHVAPLNIHQRLHGAMADLGPVQKDGFAKMSGEGGYKYHGHAEITAHVKAALEKWRVGIQVTVIDETHEDILIGKYKTPGYLTVARVLVRFVNIDAPGDLVESVQVGYGIDSGDKGTGKAVTYAVKYAMLKTFMISDGEEPDNEAFNAEVAEHRTKAAKPASQPQRFDREKLPQVVKDFMETCAKHRISAAASARKLCAEHGTDKLSKLDEAVIQAAIDQINAAAEAGTLVPDPEFD